MNGALLKAADGRTARITQTPFAWVDGAWEATIRILPIEATAETKTLEFKARVTPDTLRRWSDVGINPFLEACAQLQEHWHPAASTDTTDFTWL